MALFFADIAGNQTNKNSRAVHDDDAAPSRRVINRPPHHLMSRVISTASWAIGDRSEKARRHRSLDHHPQSQEGISRKVVERYRQTRSAMVEIVWYCTPTPELYRRVQGFRYRSFIPSRAMFSKSEEYQSTLRDSNTESTRLTSTISKQPTTIQRPSPITTPHNHPHANHRNGFPHQQAQPVHLHRHPPPRPTHNPRPRRAIRKPHHPRSREKEDHHHHNGRPPETSHAFQDFHG